MIITELKDGQGLGNQLWCFFTAKSISINNNTKLIVKNISSFKGNSFLQLHYDLNYKDERYATLKEELYYDKDLKYICSGYDARVENLLSNENYLLEGLFQSEKYFYDFKSQISKWVTTNFKKELNLDKYMCVINLRGGEYKRHKKFILPESYWYNAIIIMKSKYNITKFVVVTDDYDYGKALFPDLKIISNDIELCYQYIYCCHNIIVSNSTFSYFPISTSPIKKRIIAPKYWARFGNNKNRWVSPANYYDGWMYLDKDGNLTNSNELDEVVEASTNYYIDNNLQINQKTLSKKTIRHYLPIWMKKIIKKYGSKIFPKHIG